MNYVPLPPAGGVKSSMKGIALAIVVAYLLSLVTMIVIAPYTLSLFPVKTRQIADGAITTDKIVDDAITIDKIAEESVANSIIAAYAIPYNSTYSTTQVTRSTNTYADIDGMSVTINLERASHLIILFSTQATVSDQDTTVLWRARISNGTIAESAQPGEFYMQPGGLKASLWASLSYNWYKPNVTAGSYTIYIQWLVTGGGSSTVRAMTLTVIALPA
jgi:hypothetical protein